MTFVDLIRKHFDHLLSDHGFSLAHRSDQSNFGRQVVVFASGRCIIAFVLDRGGEVFIRVASADNIDITSPELYRIWVDIGTVVAYLSPEMTIDQFALFYTPVDRSRQPAAAAEKELVALASKIRPCWERVLELCESGELDGHRSEFEELGRERQEAIMAAMRRNKDQRNPGRGTG